jgi:hypothetical protein
MGRTVENLIQMLTVADDYEEVRKTVSDSFVEMVRDVLGPQYLQFKHREDAYQERIKKESEIKNAVK